MFRPLPFLLGAALCGFVVGCPSMMVKRVYPPYAKGDWLGVLRPRTLELGNIKVSAVELVVESGPPLKERDASSPSAVAGNSAILVDRDWQVKPEIESRAGVRVAVTGDMRVSFLYKGQEALRAEGSQYPEHFFLLRSETIRAIGEAE